MQHLTTTLTYLRARFGRDEDGATMVEYGLLVALIAAVVIAVVVLLGDNINDAFTSVNTQIEENMPEGG